MKRVRSGEESEELEWAGESERPHSELSLRRCCKGAWEEKKLLARSEVVLNRVIYTLRFV